MDSTHVIDIGPRPSIAVEGSRQRFPVGRIFTACPDRRWTNERTNPWRH